MAIQLSTGFADALNVTGSVKTLMANSILHLYSGTQPVSADAVEAGDLLMIISVGGGAFTPGVATNGLNMGDSLAGVLSKAVAETWEGLGLAAAGVGTLATWFRWYANAVVTGASTTSVRVDGSIGTTSAYDLHMSNNTVVEAGPSVINSFAYETVRS